MSILFLLLKRDEMLGLNKFFVIISVILNSTQGFLFTFDESFGVNFDKTYCDDKSDWALIDLVTVDVTDPNGSSRGVLASKNSCITSYPIPLEIGSKLEAYIYIHVTSEHSGITVILTEEFSNVLLATYDYNSLHSEFLPGWSRILIPIEFDAIARLSLLGYSENDDVIILSRLKSIPPIKCNKANKGLIAEEKRTISVERVIRESEIVNINQDDSSTTDSDASSITNGADDVTTNPTTEDNTGSIPDDVGTTATISTPEDNETADPSSTTTIDIDDAATTTTESSPLPTEAPITEISAVWDWITILLVAIGGLIGVSLLATTCYYLGKSRSKTVIVDAATIDPPRTVIIPRVKDVTKASDMYSYN